jgi:diguanylate cyclase (GGDEF)-like protein/PAS domain S-box-containing protein
MITPANRARPEALGSALALGLCYFVAASAATGLTRFGGGVAFIWVASAFLVADLRHRAPSTWSLRVLACLMASLVATGTFGLGARPALPLAIVNMAEALSSALLLRRYLPERGSFTSLPEIGVLLIVSGLLVPALSATAGAGIVHLLVGVPFQANWLGWFTGHSLGAIVVTPLAMLVINGDVTSWWRKAGKSDFLATAGLLLAMVGTSIGVFVQDQLPLLFLPFLPLMVATFRLGRLGAAGALLLLMIIASAFTFAGTGPITLVDAGLPVRAQFLQLYLAVATLMALPAAAELKHRKALHTRTQESAAFYRVLADRTGDIILALEVDGRIRFASPSIGMIGGYDPEEMVGRSATELVVAEDIDRVVFAHRQALATPEETFMVEYRARRASGEIGWFESHTRAIVETEGTATGVVNVIREITDRKERERALSRAAHTDPLTGLCNRRGFEEAYEQHVASNAESACIAMFDLDHFKKVNDRYGHATGDHVLKDFAFLLKSTVRGTDVVARLGGEEFVALFVGADVQQVRSICDRIRTRLDRLTLTSLDGHVVHATVSVGVAEVVPAMPLEAALEMVDKALYQAKERGRNRVALAA